ncbi:MAG: hypothetical protein AAGG51_26400 [Cyanobacteria bacterium P01_G01_bin.54]
MNIRFAQLKADISSEAFEQKEQQNGSVHKISYRLIEEGVAAFYGFAIADDSHLQFAIYFDDQSDVELARSIFTSAVRDAS